MRVDWILPRTWRKLDTRNCKFESVPLLEEFAVENSAKIELQLNSFDEM